MLATTWAIFKKIMQLAQWSKNCVLYIKRKSFESSFQQKQRMNTFGVMWKELGAK